MQLDYFSATGAFTLKIPRKESVLVQSLMREHGFDFSLPASTPDTAVLFTKEPYAAATFAKYATEVALARLRPMLTQIELSWRNESYAHISCPADQELWPFQKCNIEYALPRKCTLIGDQPGLGKTPVAVCFANEIRAKRTLVICPASIRIQWVKKIREWTILRWPYVVHPILAGRHGVHPNAEWTVVSYDLARTEAIGKALAKGYYDLLILDEAHYLKTTDSRRTRAVFGGGHERVFDDFASRSERILALTGTPLPNRPREAYTLARGLCWDAIDWMSEDSFRERFNPSQTIEKIDPRTGETKIYVDERSGRHGELQNRMRANFMTRHRKRDVMPQLKMPVYDIIQLEETAAVKQALKAESLLGIDPEQLEGADAVAFGAIATARRMMGIALAPQVADYIDMLIDGGEEKLVVFAYHHEVMDILQKQWQKHGVLRVDGNTIAVQKMKKVELFQADPKHQIFLGQIIACGTGTDGLQKVANHALIAEADWVHGNNEQAFDRLDRGGQNRVVQGDIFVAPGSFSEKILASALRKGHTVHSALDKQFV
jgi:SWI/SNF-related matrix-associated actin-dependent regulator of chromatin subfamily A-like protein 1